MAERELFQIGEVAKMYHLSVGTLRHYEQVGLLKPEYTDPAPGLPLLQRPAVRAADQHPLPAGAGPAAG